MHEIGPFSCAYMFGIMYGDGDFVFGGPFLMLSLCVLFNPLSVCDVFYFLFFSFSFSSCFLSLSLSPTLQSDDALYDVRMCVYNTRFVVTRNGTEQCDVKTYGTKPGIRVWLSVCWHASHGLYGCWYGLNMRRALTHYAVCVYMCLCFLRAVHAFS